MTTVRIIRHPLNERWYRTYGFCLDSVFIRQFYTDVDNVSLKQNEFLLLAGTLEYLYARLGYKYKRKVKNKKK